MRSRFEKSKQLKYTEWAGAYEAALLALDPTLAGRIDWYPAQHLFYSGKTPEEAANQTHGNGTARR